MSNVFLPMAIQDQGGHRLTTNRKPKHPMQKFRESLPGEAPLAFFPFNMRFERLKKVICLEVLSSFEHHSFIAS
jgi:hypothetical protein